jgi:glycosyltransferase involved in cell wall biosynthesis
VQQYLEECLDSVIHQTLADLEIICVNDGSTDDSLRIIEAYAARDSRIVVITGPNGGYGKAMNKGLDRATGEYIGIVEPDDYVDLHMFEDLYTLASENDLDFVKADFYRFTRGEDGIEHRQYERLDRTNTRYGQLLNPSMDPQCIRFTLNTWTGIYKREFIEKFGIRHNETPGASFQDNGFFFQTFVFAKRAMIVNKPYYKNRRDNPNSSVKNKGKVYCMNIEYDFIRDFLKEEPERWERFKYMYWWKKYHTYMFTYDRIHEKYKKEYLQRMSREYRWAKIQNELSTDVFTELEWKKVNSLISNADGFAAALQSAGAARFIKPLVPEWAKKMIFRVLSMRK